ncbi:acetylserotonin O-methyltransferase-like isoform X1 [Coffea eugenioides]|uniref:Acetylserotonin O-methyltransferase isoform X1 n=1 Tax=Coffea arabica TaxID=13443 RepID=A0A6P6S5Y9_COFAR|nr:acetylserotonin O-methyltransferase-like isoform X1 [Coffea arabica]XP_027171289.1 acetylserotonin O-methyltransferase-like isoform X1 [Coffea eugenioides]XP_027171304.1 acetylserotonin O-methyltransferase-like isoform X1 [Coffea eugenioides]
MEEEKIKKEAEEEAQAQVDIWKYVFGFTEMAVVKCAIELGIPDFLESQDGQAMTLDGLSAALGCSPSSLYRIMRFLTNRGIFRQVNQGHGCSSQNSTSNAIGSSSITYVQTPLSRLLARNGEKSMAAIVLLESSPVMLSPWLGLGRRVLANSPPPFDTYHGQDLWSYAQNNPAHSKLINDAMACDARVAVSAMINGCPQVFEGISSLVDVGGGDGTALRTLLKACPCIRGINFDLPHVVSFAPHSDGVEHVGGDMFHSVPNADAAFIMWVLHDWGDDECISILMNCKEAIPQDTGKVIIVEAVIDHEGGDDKLKDVGLMLDMVMMAHTTTGKERTSEEWAYILNKAGFSRHTMTHIQAVQSVIEAYP